MMRHRLIFLWIVLIGFQAVLGQQRRRENPKISPFLSESKQDLTVAVDDSSKFVKEFHNAFPGRRLFFLSHKIFRIEKVQPDEVKKLSDLPSVGYIDAGTRHAKEETVLGDFDLSCNAVTTVHGNHPELAGENFTLSIKEKPFDVNDIDLKGRIKLNNNFDETPTLHATIMATIAAGAGNSSPHAKGAAWAALITTSDFDRLLPDEDVYFTSNNVTVQNHSYGVGLENYYGVESREYDLFAQRNPKIVHVFSSGNQGDQTPSQGAYAGVNSFATLTGQFKTSKNAISVGTSDRFGNVVSRSSRGPAYDGRIKPELIAFGDAGSSEAAAVVSGTSLLVQNAYRNTYGTLPDEALVKAILINSAVDAGRPRVDFETGFGNLNAIGAIETVLEKRLQANVINQSEQKSFQINVNIQSNLKVTLVWSDPAAEPFNQKALINDLDLQVKNVATGETFDPWVLDSSPSISALTKNAVRGKDRLNNVEQVTIEQAEPGIYEIIVAGYAVPLGPQQFQLAYQFENDVRWIFPIANDHLPTNSVQLIRWQSDIGSAAGVLEYMEPGNSSWTTIANNINLDDRFFEWTTPSKEGLYQLRLRVGNQSIQSDIFSVSTPRRVEVGFDCEDEVLLFWNKSPGATEYKLSSLGEKFLETVVETTDTFAVLKKENISRFFSVAPVFGNVDGISEFTIDYSTQGVGCYFISFVQREAITNSSATFDVKIGTTWNVAQAELERLNKSGVKGVSTTKPALNFTITDEFPSEGWNDYRVKLHLANGKDVYSDTARVFFLSKSSIYAYPNPLMSGADLNVVVSDTTEAIVLLTDMMGRVVRQSSDRDYTKFISTNGLPAGTYVVTVLAGDGRKLFCKVILY